MASKFPFQKSKEEKNEPKESKAKEAKEQKTGSGKKTAPKNENFKKK
jgi:hypothetical protein